MNYPELKGMRIGNEEEFKRYVRWLVGNDLAYHLDDMPRDIVWGGRGPRGQPTPADLGEMVRLRQEMFGAVDPWGVLERDRGLWKLYSGRE